MRLLIVGAGFYGATCARALTDAGHHCHVIERKPHVGGHCHTQRIAEVGCELHEHGPHIFHTDNAAVWRFIKRFARFNSFVNRPKVAHQGKLYSFPINLMTLHQVFGVTSPAEAVALLARECVPNADPQNMEDWCLSTIGPRLYQLFVEGYTLKQWGRHPRELPAAIIKRIPVRLNFDDRYFTDHWQGIPTEGYTTLIERMLAGIPVECSVDFLLDREQWCRRFDLVITSGAIDEFFSYQLGPLGYRSLRFETELLDCPDFQGNAVINYTDAAVPYTRVVEHKHFVGALSYKTIVSREFPVDWQPGADPYYPVRTAADLALLARYQELARAAVPQVIFGGRLGEYRYLDMHQVIAAALAMARQVGGPRDGRRLRCKDPF